MSEKSETPTPTPAATSKASRSQPASAVAPFVPAFQPLNPSLFYSKGDPADQRLGDLARRLPCEDPKAYEQCLQQLAEKDKNRRRVIVAGYPDDEGIRLSGGRLGAKDAPDTIRKYLYKMTPSYLSKADAAIWDAGNLRMEGDLGFRHECARQFARLSLQSGAQWVAMGGGHDYGFADGAAFVDYCRTQNGGRGIRPLVINFDAHLDVRPTDNGPSSGTPFFRLLEMEREIDFVEIGLQAQCNSREHAEYARSRGARLLSMEEIEMSGQDLVTVCMNTLGDWAKTPRPTFISVDIDGFQSSYAMGCSQSWATGFEPQSFLRLLNTLLLKLDVKAFSVYEVSPRLDLDDRTSKLAALLIHRFLYPV